MAKASRATVTRTGLVLDPADPGDRQIMRRQQKAARDAGRRGDHRARTTGGRRDLQTAYDQGAAARTKKTSTPGKPAAARAFGKASGFLSRGSWRPTLRPPSRARDAGGLLSGMLLYTVVVTYVRYGRAGWTGWLKAKFLNQPMQGLPDDRGGPPKKPRPV